jgi:hypothetical protein
MRRRFIKLTAGSTAGREIRRHCVDLENKCSSRRSREKRRRRVVNNKIKRGYIRHLSTVAMPI